MNTITTPCLHCKRLFSITEKDQEFYQKVSPTFDDQYFQIPTPDLCPQCREQQRLVWRNERKLYNRTCNLTQEKTISVHAADKAYPVYSKEAWWSENWEACEYGQSFDFQQPFFAQYQNLLHKVPRIALYQKENQNCEYTQNTGWSKNCYMLGGANRNQDCYYGNYVNDCVDCVDNTMIKNSELCYECVECEQCYNCAFCKRSKNCRDSQFLVNCTNVKNSFGCVNLVNKEHCFFNEQLTPETYNQKLQSLNLGKIDKLEQMKAKMHQFEQTFPVCHMMSTHCENVSGNDIFHSKDCESCFDVSKLEDCSYSSWLHASKDCMDIYAWGMSAELCYFCLEVGSGAYQNLFDVSCDNCQSMYYSFQCYNSHDCFGCVGLKNKSYCILNKQYSQKEYEQIVARIIAHMQASKEWGQFFPMYLSGLGYNETVAQELYPLTESQALALDALWYSKADKTPAQYDISVPNDVRTIPDNITTTVFNCRQCENGYRIIKQEIEFYQAHDLALPLKCFTCRHQARTEQRNPHRLRDTSCANCKVHITTTFSATTKQPILCQNCFQKNLT